MKKYIAVILVLFSVFILVPGQVRASSYNEETVFDYADLLTWEEENELRQIAKEYEEFDVSMIFLTTADARGKSAMTYSDDFYDTNQFRPDGVLFLIDMDNRELYINTVGKCIAILPDYRIESILDTGYDYVADGEYFDCFKRMSERTGYYIKNYDGSQSTGSYYYNNYDNILTIMGPMLMKYALIALVVAGIVSLILVSTHKKANRRIPADRYMGSSFKVNKKDVAYMGCRQEVIRGYYKQDDDDSSSSRSSSRSSSSSSRSTTHTSSHGVSHGGGGRKF